MPHIWPVRVRLCLRRCKPLGSFLSDEQVWGVVSHIPTVSPIKSSLVYFISIAYTDHPVWRSHREEAKSGPPSGHRIPRIEGAMMSLLLRMGLQGGPSSLGSM